MKMITIIELPSFLSQVGKNIELNERDELLEYLARYPQAGNKIPETGGIRKLRWSGKGKGKRGGLRVIYYFYNEMAPLFLLTVYGKNEQDDLTSLQKSKIVNLTTRLKEECKAMRKKHYG